MCRSYLRSMILEVIGPTFPEGMNRFVFIADQVLMTDQRNNFTQVQLGEQ